MTKIYSFKAVPGERMKKIKLTKGKYALVDDKDFELVSKYKWHTHSGDKIGRLFYAATWFSMKTGGRKRMFLHNLLMGTPVGMEVDHRNRDGLDNRRANFKLGTKQDNRLNLSQFKNNTSGVRGVYWYKKNKKWGVHVRRNGKLDYFGLFSLKKDAISRLMLIRQNI